MPQPKYSAGSNIIRSIGLLVIILLVGLAYYFFAGRPVADRPPSLSIGGNRFQGLIGDDIGCRLNGLREFTSADVADYQTPSGVPASQHYTLKRGVHLYHTTQDTTIAEILNYIVPTENNKILIAFYNYGLGGTEAGFYLDPEMAENFPIENAASFTIPAHHGFVLISCQEGEILKLKDEELAGTGLPDNLDTIDGWVLLAIENNAKLEAAVGGLGAHLKSLWVQNGPGFNFEKVEDLTSPELSEDYYMAWFKLDSTVVEEEPPVEDDITDDIAAAVSDFNNTLDGIESSLEAINPGDTYDSTINGLIVTSEGIYDELSDTLGDLLTDDASDSEIAEVQTALNAAQDALDDFIDQANEIRAELSDPGYAGSTGIGIDYEDTFDKESNFDKDSDTSSDSAGETVETRPVHVDYCTDCIGGECVLDDEKDGPKSAGNCYGSVR